MTTDQHATFIDINELIDANYEPSKYRKPSWSGAQPITFYWIW
jgi:hypothetical protein